MAFINTAVADVLITFAVLGALFYVGIVIVGTSSYDCPFQTPVSFALRTIWKTAKPYMITLQAVIGIATSLLWLPVLTTLGHWWEVIQCQILHVALLLPSITQWHNSGDPPLPTAYPPPPHPTLSLASLHNVWESIQCRILHAALRLPQIQSSLVPVTPPTFLWLTPTALATLRGTNANDVRCTSWILWNITDPEALDAAIRLAATIRWFEDGLNVEPPYDQIVSTLKGCFDFNGKVYPGSRDRAYHSAQAVLWIHIRAMYVSAGFAKRFPLPTITHDSASLDYDLLYLLSYYDDIDFSTILNHMMNAINMSHTPAHLQWTSNALLHLSWVQQDVLGVFDGAVTYYYGEKGLPLNVVLNHILVVCVFFGWPVEEEVLKIQDKSYVVSHLCPSGHSPFFLSDRFNQIISKFSQAMFSAINTSHLQCKLLINALVILSKSENRTPELTEMAYEWCSVVCKNYSSLRYGKHLLFYSLKIGFRHLDPENWWDSTKFTHQEYHQGMATIIFDIGDQEAIGDLLHVWTSGGGYQEYYPSLQICAEHLIGLHQQPLSSRLQQLIIHTIALIGYQPFEQFETEGFFGLLDSLQVYTGGMNYDGHKWAILLLDIVESSEGIRHLSHHYWKFLLEQITLWSQELKVRPYSPQIIKSLQAAEEWEKLGYWMGVVWMVWPPEGGRTAEGDLEHIMLLLFQHQPGAIQEFQEMMEREYGYSIPKSFKRICRQVDVEAAQQDIW